MSSTSEPSEPILVIDFGNTSSAAVLVTGAQVHLLTEPVSGAQTWPSAVYWDGRQMLVGTLAEHRRQADPAGYGVDFKRWLASENTIQLGSHAFRPVEQVAAVLTALRIEAERRHGAPVRRALVTVPASYLPGDPRREWMIAAAEAAGFATVELLPEPVAAAHAPAAGSAPAEGDVVLVYDLGGGTFDTALVRMGADAPEILGHAAVDDCGGRDIDALLSKRIAGHGRQWFETLGPRIPGESTTLRLNRAVTEFAQRIKHQLSDAEEVEDYLLPSAPAYRLHRSELAELAAPVLDQTVACCRALLDRVGLAVADVTAVLLVGGCARMPAVADTLTRELGAPLRRVDEPDLATVRGAARWLQLTGDRHVPALTWPRRTVPLSFAVPGGTAQLIRWMVQPGEQFAVGQPLGRIRLPDGALWELTASSAGSLAVLLVEAGAPVSAGQWLALAHRPPTAGPAVHSLAS